MVKPELSAPGGSLAVDTLTGRVVLVEPSACVLAAGGERPEHLLALGSGTSLAAPLLSHAALRVLGRYPSLSANAVRALLLASAVPVERVVLGNTSEDRSQERRLTGYGRVSAARAEASDDHRAVLLAESRLVVDEVHLYEVPLPGTFFQPGERRALTVAMAYDPPVRPSRLDYLASRMAVRMYRGVGLDAVQAAYVRQRDRESGESDGNAGPEELRRAEVELQPADTRRGLGAHQLGAITFERRLRQGSGESLVLALRNTNKWDSEGARQGYALVVVLERDERYAELYAELSARLEALVQVEAEVDVELELER